MLGIKHFDKAPSSETDVQMCFATSADARVRSLSPAAAPPIFMRPFQPGTRGREEAPLMWHHAL